MKLITRDTDYAIRALSCIAVNEGIVSVKDLSEELDMPHAFLRKILQELTRAGFLKSFKGRRGGFELSKPAKNITVYDLACIFQGDLFLTEHVFKGKVCPRINKCKLKRKLDRLQKNVLKGLKDITIESII